MLEFRYVNAAWGRREETAEACAKRLARWLDHLIDLHPAFRHLESASDGLAKGRNLRDLIRLGDMSQLFELEWIYEGRQERYLIESCGLSGYSAATPQSILLYLRAGCGMDIGDLYNRPNGLMLSYKAIDDAETDLTMQRVLMSVLRATAVAWETDWATLVSVRQKERSKNWQQDRFAGCWAVCLTEALAQRITPPSGAIVEPLPNGGLSLSAVDGVFDPGNAEHARAADALEACLEPLWRLSDIRREP
jgi:hypothetical protein